MSRIPVYLFTGFLGSGKTTVLLKVLEEMKKQGKKPAVILNELGEVNVEKSLFGSQPVMELLNGCICCTIQDDLRTELSQFLSTQKEVDVIIIEGTGIANPKEVVESLTHPDLFDLVELYSIISLVDASKYLEYQSLFSSSKEIRTILKQQISHSSLLLLNKIDLIDEKTKIKVRKKVQDVIVDGTETIETTYGEVPIETILKKRMESLVVSANASHHHHHHEHHHFRAVKIDDIPELDRIHFEKWLKSLPEHVIRAKGLVQFTESPRVFQFQYSAGQLQLTKTTDDQQKEDPCLIIIGYQLDIEEIQASFSQQFVR
ncbi:CobW family GTP-binding protein [Bacillus alkalicellulosilyticus]|uniref:CobW family GTP-binding protein n=1 Tax=Alkalihalobacterium alkalicellulosilyticum TaxID=1912214 RepID=UPI0009966BC9|nr:GTP-binding protein [Bacillus alkalicellulosilyticus]